MVYFSSQITNIAHKTTPLVDKFEMSEFTCVKFVKTGDGFSGTNKYIPFTE